MAELSPETLGRYDRLLPGARMVPLLGAVSSPPLRNGFNADAEVCASQKRRIFRFAEWHAKSRAQSCVSPPDSRLAEEEKIFSLQKGRFIIKSEGSRRAAARLGK